MPGGRWLLGVLLVAGLAGCLDARSAQCGDGRVCPPGTACLAELDACADPAQFAACEGLADNARCAAGNVIGTCQMGACIGSRCGNHVVEMGEMCDDGNSTGGDGCSADCASNETCGNAIVDIGEQCDCGTGTAMNATCVGPNSDSAGTCSSICKLRCGDGIVEADEACDPAFAPVVSCAGATYDRGLTDCGTTCQPVIKVETCRYIGWRTRFTQPDPTSAPLVADIAPTSASTGFVVSGMNANTYTDYKGSTSPFVAPAPLVAVWTDGTAAVAVGNAGTIVRYDEGVWTVQTPPVTADLRDVWGRSGSDVYAIGASLLLHYDGASWTQVTAPTGEFRAIAGTATHIFIVGDAGLVLSYDGSQWTTEPAPTTANLHGVAATATMVAAVGDAGTIVQRDASGWSMGRTAAIENLTSIWGSATDGFFAAGDRGTVLFFDGAVWRPLSLGRGVTGSVDQRFFSVYGVEGLGLGMSGTKDLLSYEGAAWSPTLPATTETLYGLWGTSPADVFAVGRQGTILHHDGLTWTAQPSPTTADLRAVTGLASNDVWAVGNNQTLLHYDGQAWSLVASGPIGMATGDFVAIYVPRAGEAFIGGTSGIFHYAAGVLARMTTVASAALWGASRTNVWSGGPQGVAHYTGNQWFQVSVQPIRGIAATSASDIYAFGDVPLHYNGTSWSPSPFTDVRLITAAALGTHVIAAGRQGALSYYFGTQVEPFVDRTTVDLNAIFAVGRVVFMAGTDGTLETLVLHN